MWVSEACAYGRPTRVNNKYIFSLDLCCYSIVTVTFSAASHERTQFPLLLRLDLSRHRNLSSRFESIYEVAKKSFPFQKFPSSTFILRASWECDFMFAKMSQNSSFLWMPKIYTLEAFDDGKVAPLDRN